MFPTPPSRSPASERSTCRPLWRRVWDIAPGWAWAVAATVQLAVALPFWLYATPAPFHDVHRDVYRGWPFIYGLDQGDVMGDEWGPLITYFQPIPFALDTTAAVACGLPVTGLVLWIGRRVRRRAGPGGPEATTDGGGM
jgi:hypothetical protein